ncbi:50S ribosomal protein L25 [bacterium]|nr:50S ribosomal protein L25 [bacterium]
MVEFKLKAVERTQQGKQVRQLRKSGQVPGVVYGREVENRLVALDDLTFKRIYHQAGHSSLVELVLGDDKPVNVLIADVQTDHLGRILHADLHQVKMDEVVRANVPVKLIGDAPGVFNLGGTLVQPLEELEIEALPADLPQAIEVDIAGLENFDDSISVSDLKLDSKLVVLTDGHELICRVEAPRSDEEMAALEAEMGDELPEDLAEEKQAAETAAEESKEAKPGE